MLAVTLAAVTQFALPQPASAQTPLPDSFNPGANARVLALALDAGGKIVVGGGFTTLGGQTRNYIGRLSANGTLDSGFNPGANNWVLSLALQADEKILVGGSFSTLAGQARVGSGRLSVSGTLDSGFNPNVIWASYIGLSHTVQADGKILMGGEFNSLAGQPRSYLGRLNANTTLDGGFNPGANQAPWSLAVQADGKILVIGKFTILGGQTRNYIGRLNENGTLDSGFNPGANDAVLSLAVQADGKILVGGLFTTLGGQTRNRIGRLNADGTLDSGFNPGANGEVWAFGVQADGKVLVGGSFTTLGGQTRNRLARLNADGTLDSGFNPGANNWVGALALQADGKILVGGTFTTLGGQTRNYIGRLNNTGPATQSLAFDGSTITWLRGGTSPEAWRTTFDLSTDGLIWTSLGAGTRRAGGWQLAVASSPSRGVIRARGGVTGGRNNGSGWFVESQLQFTNSPTIVGDPRSVTNISGTTATFTVNATGTVPLAYHWRKDGVGLADGGNVSGARSQVLALANVQWADAGQYTVVVTNAFGSVTSRVASLTVLVPPQILTHPQSQSVVLGANALFSVTVTGTTPLYGQWRKNGVDIPGANMAALTFSVRPSDLGRYSVVVWNAAGWVESAGADLVVLAEPGNGNPPGLLTYPFLPAKQPGKDSLVLLTHGWSPKFGSILPPADVPWLNDLAHSINAYLADHARGNWQVVAYEWLFNSFTWLPDSAAENGAKEGANVGCDIVNQGWSYVHLIGNSAGAALIQATTDMVKARNPSIVVHETFLDPYLRIGYPGRSEYGAQADWADCYFAHDYLSDGLMNVHPSLTEGRLANAYNVNVTQLDPLAGFVPDLNFPWVEVISRHEWPHEFYMNTVSNNQPDAEGLGFPLSKEGGGWANHGSYPPGNQPRVLGNLAMVVQNEIKAVVNEPLQPGQLAWQASLSGVVQFVKNRIRLLTGIQVGPAPKGPEPDSGGGLPVWVSFAVPVTNQVNFVTFEAQFDSTNGAVGLLAVYWGTNLIGTVDERVVVPGQQRYSFGLPEVAPSGLYLLGFRLDPHSAVPSSVNVTNIATGFAGVAAPIQLQIARGATNSNPTITLTATPGFYYQLQTSPDLVTWTPLASVLNTDGTAQIIDVTTNSLQQRFYRAVMP
jgi:uncharacterized delta-60 repeat protein